MKHPNALGRKSFLTAAARVRSHIKSCRTVVGQSGIMVGFFLSTSLSPANFYTPNCSIFINRPLNDIAFS